MEQLVRVGQLLREVHEYHGYIHLKAVPGALPELLARAGQYADRLSTNIELPTAAQSLLGPAFRVTRDRGKLNLFR
jgi:predicted DNA-binding helix-hairpin-helix protein